MSSDRSWVERQTFLLVEVGSTVHGIGTGADDHDEMGVCLEPFQEAFGLTGEFEQSMHRTAAIREGRQDAPSQPGDTDRTVYSLRKWTRLALAGNPSVQLLLFVPESALRRIDARGSQLRELAPLFVSRQAGARFLGYMQQQRQRLTGERGQKNVNRQVLVEQFGFDTKYAGHIIRLGMQGIEYMETGRITVPMREDQRQRCLDIRSGRVELNDVLQEAGELERRLKDLITVSPLPLHPDTKHVEEWMLDLYLETWKSGWGHNRIVRNRDVEYPSERKFHV